MRNNSTLFVLLDIMTAMETNNLIITLIVLSSIYAVINLMIYHVKHERYLLVFTYSFIFLGISYSILGFQSVLPPFIAYVIYNAVNFLSYVTILMGIRLVFGFKAISRSSIVVTVVSLVLVYFFGLVTQNYIARVSIVSLTIAYYFIEALMDLNHKDSMLSPAVKKVTRYFIVFGMVIWLGRLLVILYFGAVQNLSLINNFQANVFLILSVASSSLWFALTMWLDTKKSMYDLDEKNDQLAKLALLDQLTGLANRRYFEYDIEFLVATSRRNNTPMSMLLIDLDRFKLVNDVHGHDVGDQVLIQTAEIIRSSLRASDRAYRWGGEEFLVVLPETEHAGMARIAEKINQNFRNSLFDVIGSITVSIGGAVYESDEAIDLWFKRVDLSLYKAKQNGRDRYEIWIADEEFPEFFSRIEWDKRLESGNGDIDADHQLLIYYVNDLYDSIITGVPIDTIKELILRMSSHLHSHFSKEEGLLYRSGYIDYIEHRSIHQRILQEYEIIAGKALNGEISLAALMSFLVENVVIKHISEEDSKFFGKVK